jgi:transposase
MPETSPRGFIGIDPALETFAISLYQGPAQRQPTTTFANEFEGFSACRTWLSEHAATPEASVICVEATGVYAEALCYFLHEQGYPVSLESPQKVKRAFKTTTKNDPTDARQIAE